MPATTAYERESKYKTREYRGERGVGGNLVYAGEHVPDEHLFVHRVAPGGFDRGPDADVFEPTPARSPRCSPSSA